MAAAPPEADPLFQKHSVSELRGIEVKIRADIERKKHDLRLMVGERYRDLIEAADSIRTMRESAATVQNMFERIQEECHADRLKRKLQAQTERGKDDAAERQKTLLYPVAAQIKLLVDTPEQIWHALENHQYLRASRLYLLAKKVLGNLQTSPEAATLKLLNSFPVVKRQWDAVSHFRSQIIERSMQHLGLFDQTEESVSETLCAIMLLDFATTRQALEKLLERRRSSIVDHLRISNSDPAALTDALCDIVRTVVVTFQHVANIFLPPARSGPPTSSLHMPVSASLLGTNIHSLSQRPTDAHDETTPTQISNYLITGLYTDKTNVHIISRHLPSSIQNYTPALNVTASTSELSRDIIREMVNLWIENIGQLMKQDGYALLKRIESGKVLSRVRESIMKLLCGVDKRADAGNDRDLDSVIVEGVNTDNWQNLCLRLCDCPISLWSSLMREIINMRSADIVRQSLDSMFERSGNLLRKKLRLFADEAAGGSERDIAGFVWATEDAVGSPTGLDGKVFIRAESPLLRELSADFETSLRELKEDLDPLLVATPPDEKQGRRLSYHGETRNLSTDPFYIQRDGQALVTLMGEVYGHAISKYKEALMALLFQIQPKSDTDSHLQGLYSDFFPLDV
ncbi:Golgi transport complex subunit 1 [Borealophlyctis nickersoniae]|nr:Golgi transport complex subunit 1 [Borealophlyctis nickersoniae]